MSIAQKLYALGEIMSDNLEAKGVIVDSEDTLKDMADKILTIPPVIVGISLSSSLNLSVPSNIKYYDTVVLTATLTVFYDDTSQTNVDMHGTLQGATVIFKDGQNNTIGSAITDINGVATYNITANSSSMEYYAVFSGTDDYSSSTSNHVTINPQHDYNLEFSQDTYVTTSGSATVRCTLTDNGVPVPNATVSLSGSDGSLYTGITNNQGSVSYNINIRDTDITFTASFDQITATCIVRSSVFYDAGSPDNVNLYQSISIKNTNGKENIAWNASENAYVCSKNTSGYSILQFNDIVLYNNIKISADIKLAGSSWQNNGILGFIDKDNPQCYCFGGWVQGQQYYRIVEFNGSTEVQTTSNVTWSNLSLTEYNHHELKYEDGVVTYTVTTPNNVSKTLTLTLRNSNYIGGALGLFTECQGTNQCYIKNIRVEPL